MNGIYEISNLGRVKSLKFNKEKILKSTPNRYGYYTVGLSKNNIKKTEKVHILVARHFIEYPYNKLQVNHKDGNKENNTISNLEWVTAKENIQHAWKNGLNRVTQRQIQMGKENAIRKKKVVYQYDLEGNLIKKRDSRKEAGEYLHINPAGISQCCNNKAKTSGKYRWSNVLQELLED